MWWTCVTNSNSNHRHLCSSDNQDDLFSWNKKRRQKHLQSLHYRRKPKKLLHGLSIQPIAACSAGCSTPQLRKQAQEIVASGWRSLADHSLTFIFQAPSLEALIWVGEAPALSWQTWLPRHWKNQSWDVALHLTVPTAAPSQGLTVWQAASCSQWRPVHILFIVLFKINKEWKAPAELAAGSSSLHTNVNDGEGSKSQFLFNTGMRLCPFMTGFQLGKRSSEQRLCFLCATVKRHSSCRLCGTTKKQIIAVLWSGFFFCMITRIGQSADIYEHTRRQLDLNFNQNTCAIHVNWLYSSVDYLNKKWQPLSLFRFTFSDFQYLVHFVKFYFLSI